MCVLSNIFKGERDITQTCTAYILEIIRSLLLCNSGPTCLKLFKFYSLFAVLVKTIVFSFKANTLI